MRETMREMLSGVDYDNEPRPKLIAPNTVQYYRNGCRTIRLHRTDIMVYSENGKTCRLYTGGWLTITTKDRLNRFMPGRGRGIYNEKGQWYIGDRVPFFEGIELNTESGAIEHLKTAALKAERESSRKKKCAREIDRFVKRIHELAELPQPCNGDCWLCMADAGKVAPVKNSYDPGNGTGQKIDPAHLVSHIQEGYLHGSLIVNAMRWAGRTDAAIGTAYHMHKADKASGRYHGRQSWAACDLRRFLRSQLGLAV